MSRIRDIPVRTPCLRRPAALALLAVLAVAGCQDPGASRGAADTEVLTRPDTMPDAAPAGLEAMSLAELEAVSLPGELACAFTEGGQTLLLARGDVASTEPARGVVRLAGRLRTLSAAGGFDAMLHGTRFEGDGLGVEVVPTGPAVGRGESPPVPAELVVHLAAGTASQAVAGHWQCGP